MTAFSAANMNFGQGRDRQHLQHLARHAHAAGLVECIDRREAQPRPLDIAALVPAGWTAHQDTSSVARAGSAIILRDDVLRVREGARLRLKVSARPWFRGARLTMETRHMACLPVEHVPTEDPYFLVAVHLAPKRYKALWPRQIRRLRRVVRRRPNVVILTDGNMPAAELVERLNVPGLTWAGAEVMAVLWNNRHLEATATAVDRWGQRHGSTDHPDVTAELEHRR
jgi:hypothetical protein